MMGFIWIRHVFLTMEHLHDLKIKSNYDEQGYTMMQNVTPMILLSEKFLSLMNKDIWNDQVHEVYDTHDGILNVVRWHANTSVIALISIHEESIISVSIIPMKSHKLSVVLDTSE